MQLGTSVKFNLKTHMKYQHDTIEMKCNLCSFSGNRIMLCHHKKNSHGDLRQCTECDYKTRGTANMSNRQRVKHQGISFVGLWGVWYEILVKKWTQTAHRQQTQGSQMPMPEVWLQGSIKGKYEDPQPSNARELQISLWQVQLYCEHEKKLDLA